ncbi:MAG: SH3 domain-containing protein, partial [Chloroflexota bacterium]
IFFWRQQRFSVDEWQTIRNQVDPNRTSYWIAEGVDIAYQAVFDGHHLYSIAWAASPAGQLAKWGDRVRNYESANQVDRLWVATAMPGYNDTLLPRADAFAVPRRNGDYYRETWQGAVASQPDMIIITSFNEWPEGTHIEPSASYGNLYLDVTRELVTTLRGNPPAVIQSAVEDSESAAEAAPQAAPRGQETETSEAQALDPPYLETENITNVRQGPSTDFSAAGQLSAGTQLPVVGRNEASDWVQIDFEAGNDGKGWIAVEVIQFVGEIDTVPVVDAPALEEDQAAEASESTDESSTDTTTDDSTTATEEATEESVTQTDGESPTVTALAGGVNVRTGPGLEFSLLGRLDEGVSAPVVARDETGDWLQIEYEDGENGLAWVAKVVVDFSGDETALRVVVDPSLTPLPTPTPTPEPIIAGVAVGTGAINVRAEPSTESAIMGGFYLGERANVLAINDEGTWWQIEFPDGIDGTAWVAIDFVDFEGDRDLVPIFGQEAATPTPIPTDTPTPSPEPPTATPAPIEIPATFAPTPTSIYQATSDALIENRGTPDPSLTEDGGSQLSLFSWGALPWGILSGILVAILLWYQLRRRRR